VVHSRSNEIWFIQSKRDKGHIGDPVVPDFFGALRAANADRGAIITTGEITQKARLWAEGKPIHLYDGAQFLKIVTSTRKRATLVEQQDKLFTRRKSDQVLTSLQPAFAAAGAVTTGVNALVNAILPRRESEPEPVSFTPAVDLVEPPAPVRITSSAAQTVLTPEFEELTGFQEVSSETTDKAPFMNLNEPPECPVCNLPMVEKVTHNVLGQTRYKYVCQNSPQCRVTLPKE
jgi:hypothetical protein